MNVLRLLFNGLIIVVIVAWVLANPDQAGADVHSWITGIVHFAQHIGGG